jgi:dethiobiotin synthase
VGKIIFVTGTDTGAGKTLLTGLLLIHLRRSGKKAWAIKPFCSGVPTDVELFYKIQERELTRDLINPFHFPEPVAPLISSRKHRRKIALEEVVKRIRSVQTLCEFLFVEGSGGLLVPLGEGYMVADVVKALRCPVMVAARNKLGAINHALLTAKALNSMGDNVMKVVLMDRNTSDLASKTNQRILEEILKPIQVFRLPYCGKQVSNGCRLDAIKRSEKKLKKTLASIARMDTFYSLYGSSGLQTAVGN